MTRLPLWALLGPVLLIGLYAMLIFFALFGRVGFYEAMAMPQPNHGFMHISWTGKTIAIWGMMLVAALLRRVELVALALVGVVVQQLGDTWAGQATAVDVVISQIGLVFSAITLVSLLVVRRTR